MERPDLFKKKKKHELFEEADVDPDSDHPVHEEFVDEKGLRETKKKKK
jgi:hypothetical protein